MDTRRLYRPHERSLATLYADIEGHALAQETAFVGTAGSLVQRSNATGFRYYSHQYYDGDGKKRERYLAGPTGDSTADAAAQALSARIREQKDLVPSLRLLGREGFLLVDGKTYGVLASLHNHGIFAAGAALIGSHAYGVLLNRMGIQAAAYATEDIDIARRDTLALPRAEGGFLAMLRGSGIDFAEVPELDRKRPSTSFKQPGRARFHVDLLAPSRDESFPVIAIPELGAHATGLPYLGYLLAETQPAMAAAREGCCAVRVPVPERYAVHKLIVSRLRAGRSSKAAKDLDQAAVLCAALAELHPGALETALGEVPKRAKKYVTQALDVLARRLAPHPRALEELGVR